MSDNPGTDHRTTLDAAIRKYFAATQPNQIPVDWVLVIGTAPIDPDGEPVVYVRTGKDSIFWRTAGLLKIGAQTLMINEKEDPDE